MERWNVRKQVFGVFCSCLSEDCLGQLHVPHDPDLYNLLFYLVFGNLQTEGTHMYVHIVYNYT